MSGLTIRSPGEPFVTPLIRTIGLGRLFGTGRGRNSVHPVPMALVAKRVVSALLARGVGKSYEERTAYRTVSERSPAGALG